MILLFVLIGMHPFWMHANKQFVNGVNTHYANAAQQGFFITSKPDQITFTSLQNDISMALSNVSRGRAENSILAPNWPFQQTANFSIKIILRRKPPLVVVARSRKINASA